VTLTIAGVVTAVTLVEWWIGTPRAILVAALVKPWTREGEWWRLLSASFLHVSFSHLSGNMFALLLLGRLVEIHDGHLRVALVYLTSVLGCSLASFWLNSATSLGASGGVMGLAGYLVVVAGRRHSQAPGWVRRQVATMILLPTIASGLIGFLFIDNAGHAGGLVAGALIGSLVLWLGNRPENLRALATISRIAAAVLVVAAAFTGIRLVAQRGWPVRGLDHVPVAVNNLDSAADRFRALGFTLKPGRPHDNGITNLHAKFADETELELITAPDVRDDLTRTYREHLAKGDGPAFLALFAPERTPEVVRDERELPPYIFFGPRNASPTDRPEYFQHANTAESLVAVWLAGDLSKERALFQVLGATLTEEIRDIPVPTHVTVAKFAEGQILMMPVDGQVVPGRPIVGVSLRVKSLDFILQLHIPGTVVIKKQNRVVSAFVPPESANGLWIEFWAPGSLQ
jgi:membrane associated rhomboid family serine protease